MPRCTEISISGGDKGGQVESFRGACATRQFGDGGVRFSLGPFKTEGKRQEKTKENEGKPLKTKGKWRKIVKKL